MKNIRGLADKVMKDHLKVLDGKIDRWSISQLKNLLFESSTSMGYESIEVNKYTAIISYPYSKVKIKYLKKMVNMFGFDANTMNTRSEIPYYIQDFNLIITRSDANHRLAILWEVLKRENIILKVEKLNIQDDFLELLVVDKKKNTVNGFRLCDVEVDFLLKLQKKDRWLRVKKYILNWIKSKLMKSV